MSMIKRIRMHAARDETGEVRHVDHEKGADRIRDRAKAFKVDEPGISRATGYDDLGLVFLGQPLDLVHVDALIFAAHRVGNRLEPLTGLVRRRAMGQMSARREIETHESVAGLHQRKEYRLV